MRASWRSTTRSRSRTPTARASGPAGRALGPDAPLELVLDRSDLATDGAAAAALERVTRFWNGDGVP